MYLVTGGAGFIGSSIVKKLLNCGCKVRVLDNFSFGKKENLTGFEKNKNFELFVGDITDKKTCLNAVKNIKYVLHQAALKSVSKSFENPDIYNDVNINGTVNLLEACVKNKIKTFVFASSSSVYGDVKKFPQKEKIEKNPLSPYALSKLTGEHYCKIFNNMYDLNTVCLRYFNVFGPNQPAEDEYSAVIPLFIKSILKNKQPFIYGSGKQSRDFVFIDDVVNANLNACKIKNLNGVCLNIANGKDTSIISLYKTINKIVKKNIKPKFKPKKQGEIFKSLADIKKAKKMIKYNPLFNFEENLKITIESFKEQ